MKLAKYIFMGAAAASLALSSCKKAIDVQTSPNAIVSAQAQLIFTGLLLNLQQSPWSYDQRHNQYYTINESYYGSQDYAWGTTGLNFTQLRNVAQLEKEANKIGGDPAKPYLAIAKFLKAYFYIAMTEMLGDIPLSEAMKGESDGIFQPKYDAQKDVYKQCLLWLEEANTEITPVVNTQSVDGDFFFKGNLKKWQALINSYKLRVLISLSKRADNTPDLQIKQQFAAIVNDAVKYPVITTYSSNRDVNEELTLYYNSGSRDNNYVLWPANGVVIKSDLRNHVGATYIDILKTRQDPRLFIVAAPTDSAKNSGDPLYATKFTSFRGGRTGELQTTLKSQATAGKLSTLNFDFWVTSPGGVPCALLGVPEVMFTIAEGINRGWVAGDAADYYKKGITASMKFYGVKQADIDVFLLNPLNVYAGDNANGLSQVLTQKYVAFFQNSGRQAYYQYRRTGIPAFDIGPANNNLGVIPKRWRYPSGEYSVNETSLKASLQSQYGGADDINGTMWLIQ